MQSVFEKRPTDLLYGKLVRGFQGFPPMFHSHGELLYIVSGSLDITIDGKDYALQEGQLSILFPYLTHSYQKAPEAQVLFFLFDPSVIAFTGTMLAKHPVCPVMDGKAFEAMLLRALDMLQRGRTKTATAYLNAVLGEFLEVAQLTDAPEIDRSAVVKVLEYCAEHFAEPISLKTIAEQLFISQSYVSKIFSDKLRYSFREHINSLRIGKAKELLTDTALPISEIMFACGFSNQSSFNRVFRESCGLSPRQYREAHASR